MCLSKNPIYAKSEDFDFVENFIRSHCANDGGVEPDIKIDPSYYYNPDNNSVINVVLDSITVESSTPKTLIGLAGGYVNGRLSGIKIDGTSSIKTNGNAKTPYYDGLSQVNVEPIPNNYIDTTDADATAINIRNSKTAYVNGQKITGTLPVLTYPVNPSSPSDYSYQFIAATTASKVVRDGTTTSNHRRHQQHRMGLAHDYSFVRHTYLPDIQIKISPT